VRYVGRRQAERLGSLLRSFPAVLLVGPRQCGKSTLATHALPGWTRLDLERPADLAVLAPVEIKLGAAVDQYGVAGLRQCMKALGLRRGWVVSTTRERRRLSPQIEIVPWSEIAAGQVDLF
jgi:predicted AAA+ superfamily ATPase